ncbi:anti-sigma factor [Ardenticatena maritima]|nr:anti-sigma factor [Ardenticatena maritima]
MKETTMKVQQAVNCHECLEQLELYLVGALPEEEAAAVRFHLHTCPTCAAEAAAYDPIIEALHYTPPLSAAPPTLVQRVAAIPARYPRAHATRKPRWSLWGGLAALFIVGLLLSNLWLYRNWRTTQAELQQQRDLIAHLAAGEWRAVRLNVDEPLQNAPVQAVLYYPEDDPTAPGYLIIRNLPPPPSGKAYQLWLIRPEGMRESGGIFTGGDTVVLPITPPDEWRTYQGVGVTIEPAGGSPGPTGPRVLNGGL